MYVKKEPPHASFIYFFFKQNPIGAIRTCIFWGGAKIIKTTQNRRCYASLPLYYSFPHR